MSSVCTTFVSEMTKKILHIALTCFLFILAATPIGATSEHSVCPMVKIEAVRLPDLNIPRTSHNTLFVNGEVVVIGGHTSGFVPTRTAEYYHDGKWQLMDMVYDHDQGFSIPMKSGKVMIAGGHDQDLGIGHIFAVELYDPVSHTFEGYGCLDKKRVFAECLEMEGGRVIISGNWYMDDGIEEYKGDIIFSNVRDLPVVRSVPYILRTAKDNAVIFGSCDGKGNPFDTIRIDRLNGEAFTDPLFETWQPQHVLFQNHSQDAFIGDEKKGEYAYLLPVFNANKKQLAIVKAEGEQFTLLPTDSPIPMSSRFGSIDYFSYIVADRKAGKAYIMGSGKDKGDDRLYVLCIEYRRKPATLTLYYTDPLKDVGITMPVLTADGDLVMAGGYNAKKPNNFKPYASALLLHVGSPGGCAANAAGTGLWVLLAALVLLAVAGTVLWLLPCRRKRSLLAKTSDSTEKDSLSAVIDDEDLMQRLCLLMEEKRPYLRAELKQTEVAEALNVGARELSDCIKNRRDCSFAQFVNGYRVEYVKQQLRRHSDKKITTIGMDSGFANETSFFRTFKAFTGMTPKEWIARSTGKID